MKLLERVAAVGMRRHLARNTIECYQRWIEAFLRYCAEVTPDVTEGGEGDDPYEIPLLEEPPVQAGARAWRHPRELGAAEVGHF